MVVWLERETVTDQPNRQRAEVLDFSYGTKMLTVRMCGTGTRCLVPFSSVCGAEVFRTNHRWLSLFFDGCNGTSSGSVRP